MFKNSTLVSPSQVVFRATRCAIDFAKACIRNPSVNPGMGHTTPIFANSLWDFVVHVDAYFLNIQTL